VDKGWMDFLELGYVERIRIRRSRRIRKSKKIGTQLFCGEYPF
jgi:hypothetical protein